MYVWIEILYFTIRRNLFCVLELRRSKLWLFFLATMTYSCWPSKWNRWRGLSFLAHLPTFISWKCITIWWIISEIGLSIWLRSCRRPLFLIIIVLACRSRLHVYSHFINFLKIYVTNRRLTVRAVRRITPNFKQSRITQYFFLVAILIIIDWNSGTRYRRHDGIHPKVQISNWSCVDSIHSIYFVKFVNRLANAQWYIL